MTKVIVTTKQDNWTHVHTYDCTKEEVAKKLTISLGTSVTKDFIAIDNPLTIYKIDDVLRISVKEVEPVEEKI